MRRNTLAALALSVLGLVACQSTGEPDGAWQQGEVQAPSDRVLWQVSRLALQKMRFPSGGVLDPASGKLKSGWRTQLHPFQGEGFRERAEVEIEPVEQGRWMVRTRVAKQTNEALVSPLDPRRAEWEWTGDDVTAAQVLLMHITSSLGDELEMSQEPDPLEAILDRGDD